MTGNHNDRGKLVGSIAIVIRYPGAKGKGIKLKTRLTIDGISEEVIELITNTI